MTCWYILRSSCLPEAKYQRLVNKNMRITVASDMPQHRHKIWTSGWIEMPSFYSNIWNYVHRTRKIKCSVRCTMPVLGGNSYIYERRQACDRKRLVAGLEGRGVFSWSLCTHLLTPSWVCICKHFQAVIFFVFAVSPKPTHVKIKALHITQFAWSLASFTCTVVGKPAPPTVTISCLCTKALSS